MGDMRMRPSEDIARWFRAVEARLRRRGGEEAGFTIVEVMVTGLVVIAAMVATFGALEAAGRAGSEQRHHTASYSIAQQDQARMRSLRVSELLELDQTRTVSQGGTSYTVRSQANYVNSTTGTASCAEGESPADYVSIRSTVSWPSIGSRPPTTVQSIVTPPNGAFGANRGTLVVAVRDGADAPIAGMTVSGSGAGTFSAQTNENGCAVFPNLPAGDYSLTPSTAAGVVDRDGVQPGPTTVSVVDQSTNTVVLLFDSPGTVDVTFKTRINGSVVPTQGDSVVAFNTGMTVPRSFGTVGTPQSTIAAGPLFPFASPNTFYAGSCEANNPNPTEDENPPAAAAMASIDVLGNQTVGAEIQLPALNLTVRRGNGAALSGARVVISDNGCEVGGQPVKRVYTTNATGKLDAPGLPYGNYAVCASATRTALGVSGGNAYRQKTVSSVDVKTTATDASLIITFSSSNSGDSGGQCP